jgi:hypothetical protein
VNGGTPLGEESVSHEDELAEENTQALQSAEDYAGVGGETARVVPNAPSEPVWTLALERPALEPAVPVSESLTRREPPAQAPEPPAMVATAARVEDSAPPSAVTETTSPRIEPEQPEPAPRRDEAEQPPRKGWWQRPFRPRE